MYDNSFEIKRINNKTHVNISILSCILYIHFITARPIKYTNSYVNLDIMLSNVRENRFCNIMRQIEGSDVFFFYCPFIDLTLPRCNNCR